MNQWEREVNSLSFGEMKRLSKKDMEWITTESDPYLRNYRREVSRTTGRNYGVIAAYFVIYQRVKNYQVIRYVQVKEYDSPINRRVHEPLRFWIDRDGHSVIECKLRQCLGNNLIDPWCVDTKLEIRRPAKNGRDVRTLEWSGNFLKIKSLIPELKRMDFKKPVGATYNYTIQLLQDGHLEMLHRMGLYELCLKYYQLEKNKEDYWTAIRIALRHKFQLDDDETLRIWWDMVSMEIKCGADIHNPHFVAPDDLREMHDLFLGRSNNRTEDERRKAQEAQEMAEYERIKKQEDKYTSSHRKWLTIAFSDDTFSVHVLQSIKEFLDEGISMHHCVFANGYYKSKDSVIVSIRNKEGKRVETAEIDVKRFMVLQQYGKFDRYSAYHKQIKELLNDNLWRFKRASRQVERRKAV